MSKEHAYAYEAGYRDGSINYELDHCPSCKNVADLQEALAENAKLQKLCVKALEWLRWAGGITCPPEVPDEFADELRKLGVEVDE